MPYGKSDIVKQSNVNYVGKDFNDLKSNLMKYVQSYFPNTYKDFNETSPGMMLLELSAYVGDVLNFYIDQQYKEMMIPLTEDKRNLMILAKSHGYKINSIAPAYANLTFTTTINADTAGKPLYTSAGCVTLDRGVRIASSDDSTLIFETLGVVDFKISSSADPAAVVTQQHPSTGMPTKYTLTRKVRSISGETKTASFSIGAPTKFKKLTLNESNVIEVLKVVDMNNNVYNRNRKYYG